MMGLTLAIIFLISYPWPMRPFDTDHPLSAVLGDARDDVTNPRFHRGIDIPAVAGTGVFSIVSGRNWGQTLKTENNWNQ